MLTALARALAAGDAAAVEALYDPAVPWLGPDGTSEGAPAAAARHLALAAAAQRWDPPQQRGAKAVLRWEADGRRGALVVEVRRGVVVFAAEG